MKCATIGCRQEAVTRIGYSFPESREETETDAVCAECVESYLRRPVFKARIIPRTEEPQP